MIIMLANIVAAFSLVLALGGSLAAGPWAVSFSWRFTSLTA